MASGHEHDHRQHGHHDHAPGHGRDAVPPHINTEAVTAYLAALPGVCEVHDLHIWSMSTTEVALTAHLVVPWRTWSPSSVRDASIEIERRFGIGHVTIQVEPDDQGEACRHTQAGAV